MFTRLSCLAVIVALFALAACSDEDPTAAPTNTATPTQTPAAQSTPTDAGSVGIPFWQFDGSSTGRDLVALLTAEEASCLENRLGASFQELLRSPLTEEAGELLAGDESGPSPGADCLTEEHAAAAGISMLSIRAEGFSAATQACITELLREDSAIVEALGQPGDAEGGPATLRLIACLTPEEAASLTPPGDGPTLNPTDLACLIKELEGTSSGERIIAVLSGADASGAGLSMEESAMLGQAVKACGIETDFGFPDVPGNEGGSTSQGTMKDSGLPPEDLRPVDVGNPRAFLSGLSDGEQSCLSDKDIGPQELLQMTGRTPRSSPETTAAIINCLQDETVLRLFLTTLVGLVEPFSPETSMCIEEGLVLMDLRRILAPTEAGGTPVNSLALGMAALNVSVVCMNDDEWETYAPRLGMQHEDREIGSCLFEELGGPAKLAEAMQASSSGEMAENFIKALGACGVETSLSTDPPTYEGHEASPIWTFKTDGWVLTAPVVADGVVYVGSDDGNLYALAADSGEKLWSFATGDVVRSVPSVVDGTVYFGSNDNHLYALHAATGEELWRYDTGDWVQYSPIVGNGRVYLPARGEYDRTVHAVDAGTGEIVWVAEPPYPIDERLAPTVHGDRVYAQGAEYGAFYAIDTATGEIAWQAEVGGYVESAPTVLEGAVYLTVTNQAYAFDEATGELIWSVNTEEFPARDFPALVVDGIYYLAPSDYVYALDAATGEEMWSYESYELSSSPVAAAGVLYGASRSAEYLFALDAFTGEVLWSRR